MTNTHHNEDPAFPSGLLRGDGMTDVPIYRGLSMRDYFAAKAMAAMTEGSWPDSHERPEITKRAYAMADEMLRARNA